MDDSHIVKKGAIRSVAFAVDASGNCPARDDLDKGKFTVADLAKFISIVNLLVTEGGCTSKNMFKKERDKIYGIKCRQLRVACFWDTQESNVLRLTSAFKKKQDKWPEKEFKRANRIRDEHIQQAGKAQNKKGRKQ